MKTIALWLRALAEYLDPTPLPEPVPVPEVSTQLAAARLMVRQVAELPASGEYKRHQVYARMIDRFPSSQKRDLALVIEQAVQEL